MVVTIHDSSDDEVSKQSFSFIAKAGRGLTRVNQSGTGHERLSESAVQATAGRAAPNLVPGSPASANASRE